MYIIGTKRRACRTITEEIKLRQEGEGIKVTRKVCVGVLDINTRTETERMANFMDRNRNKIKLS